MMGDISANTSTNIISLINQDKQRLSQIEDLYVDAQSSDEKQQLIWHLIRQTCIHICAKEEVFYGKVHDLLGPEAGRIQLRDHQRARDILYQLSHVSFKKMDNRDIDESVKSAISFLQVYLDTEERFIFPQVTGRLTEPEMERLGRKFLIAKEHAVTRPHPWTPKAPFLNKLCNSVTSPLDNMADMWRFAGNADPVLP